ncbi:MAG: Ca-activated chloride channel family protein [Myxococcota bacterium]
MFGKYKGRARGTVTVTGQTGSGAFKKVLKVSEASTGKHNRALKYLWARHRIQTLTDLATARSPRNVKDDITKLGLKYGLMTKYTSFVAVDDAVRNKPGKSNTTKQPVPLPKGVDGLAIGGTVNPGSFGGPGAGFGGGGMASGSSGQRMGRVQFKEKKRRPNPAMAPKKKTKPIKILVGTPVVLGPLDKSLVARVLRRHHNRFQMCGQVGVGTYKFQLHVNAQGLVVNVKLLNEKELGVLATCLKRTLLRLRFPAGEKLSLVTVTIGLK